MYTHRDGSNSWPLALKAMATHLYHLPAIPLIKAVGGDYLQYPSFVVAGLDPERRGDASTTPIFVVMGVAHSNPYYENPASRPEL